MAKIDIRSKDETITEIEFAYEHNNQDYASALLLITHGVAIASPEKCVFVGKNDVENLIKALQKAVELGWTK